MRLPREGLLADLGARLFSLRSLRSTTALKIRVIHSPLRRCAGLRLCPRLANPRTPRNVPALGAQFRHVAGWLTLRLHRIQPWLTNLSPPFLSRSNEREN